MKIKNIAKGQTFIENVVVCIVIALLLSMLFVGTSNAATITRHVENNVSYFLYKGTIRYEDEAKLKDMMIKYPNTKWVILHSDGGYVSASMQIGILLRDNNMNTIINAKGHCASACNYIFLGGVKRLMPDTAKSLWHPSWSAGYSSDKRLSEIDLEAQIHAMRIAQYIALLVPKGKEYVAMKFLSRKVWNGQYNRSRLYDAPKSTLLEVGIVTD